MAAFQGHIRAQLQALHPDDPLLYKVGGTGQLWQQIGHTGSCTRCQRCTAGLACSPR
jgi:hypothetical protein